ncbi:MAG TPA: PadR family transcriptional regulator [Chloroflexi bacterium]|jgi:DNA-binding PadR family transcriptional regulator|nr:PadR family transcriptional regulator [Chloroflexota bacterium]
MRGEILKGHLDLLLLATVAGRPGHGYEILGELRRRSQGAFALAEGTVYPALHRLEAAGVLRSHWTVVSGRRRRIYSLTRSGRRALATQQRELDRFVLGVRAVLGTAT